MNIKLTPNETQIFHQLQQAAWTLQSLPADLQSRPAGLRSAWPEMCRKTMVIYGQTRRNLTDRGLEDDEIDYLFANDLIIALNICHDLYPRFTSFTPARQAALISMAV